MNTQLQKKVVKRVFSLIELVLGLGVLAFGIASVTALLSRSLSTNRVSIGETYTATHGDQLLHFYSARMRAESESMDNWDAWGTSLPTEKVGESDEKTTTEWEQWYGDAIVAYGRSGTSPSLHRIIQKNALGDVEYQAVCRVWRSPIVLYNYSSGNWATETLAYGEAMVLNLEISWPAQLPYARRRKSLFQLEVYNRSS